MIQMLLVQLCTDNNRVVVGISPVSEGRASYTTESNHSRTSMQ